MLSKKPQELIASIICCGNVSFSIIGTARTLPVILVGAVVAALGYGSPYPAIQSLCMQMEPRARRAVASNTLYAGLDIGFFLGPLLGGFIREYATYRVVLLSGFVPVVLAIVVFTIGWPACSRRLEATKETQ